MSQSLGQEQADLILLGVETGGISDDVGYDAGYETGAISSSVGGLQHVGYDETGAAIFRQFQRGAPAPRRIAPTHQGAHPGEPAVSRVYSKLPGIPSQDSVMIPMPLLTSAFTATSGVSLPVNQAPTKGFRPRRMVYVETRTGASATGLVTLLTPTIGSRVQAAASGALSAQQYAPNAYDTDVKWDDLQPGVPLTMTVAITVAPTTTDRVDFALSVNGESIS